MSERVIYRKIGKPMRNILYMIGGSLSLLLFMTGCKSADGAKDPMSLTSEMGAAEVQPG